MQVDLHAFSVTLTVRVSRDGFALAQERGRGGSRFWKVEDSKTTGMLCLGSEKRKRCFRTPKRLCRASKMLCVTLT